MKLLFTEGIGASQTTTNAQDEKIPVYETKTAAENDLANLEVGQIIATKDEGNELSNPVDVVQDGNMHAVTSNAVADYVDTKIGSIVGSVVSIFNFEDYYKATERTEHSGLIVFMRVFTEVKSGAYILNLCEDMSYYLIGETDVASFTFDVNTCTLGITVKPGYGQLTTHWATILG